MPIDTPKRFDELEEFGLTIWRPKLPYTDRQELIGWAEGMQAYADSDDFAAPASCVLFRPSEEVSNVLMRLSINYSPLVKQITDLKDFCEKLFARIDEDTGAGEDLARAIHSLGSRILEAIKTMDDAERDPRFLTRLAKSIVEIVHGLTEAGRRSASDPKTVAKFPTAPGFLIAAELSGEGSIEEIQAAINELVPDWLRTSLAGKPEEFAKSFYRRDGVLVSAEEFQSKYGRGYKWSAGDNAIWYHFNRSSKLSPHDLAIDTLYRTGYQLTPLAQNKLLAAANPTAIGQLVPADTHAEPNDASPTSSKTTSYTVAALREMTGLQNTALNKYAKAAGVQTPRRGQRNFTYLHSDAVAVLNQIVRTSSERRLVSKCREAILDLEKITE